MTALQGDTEKPSSSTNEEEEEVAETTTTAGAAGAADDDAADDDVDSTDSDDSDDADDRCHLTARLQSISFCNQQQQRQQQPPPPPPRCNHHHHNPNRKLRVLIITMGGSRQQAMEQLFQQPHYQQWFEPPIFRPGVSSRSLRNRRFFLETAAAAGLLPELEWQALAKQFELIDKKKKEDNHNHNTFFDCLQDVPITTTTSNRRKGSAQDIALHYSVELWRKAKTINRGRAVLACTLAHLLALKYNFQVLQQDPVDLILEDNIRGAPPPVRNDNNNEQQQEQMTMTTMAERIREACQATQEWEQDTGKTCHLRYLGWLGSCTNLEWVYERHIPQRQYQRRKMKSQQQYSYSQQQQQQCTIAPFPTTQDIERDLEEITEHETSVGRGVVEKEEDNQSGRHALSGERSCAVEGTRQYYSKPGGTPVWGAYGYWISKQAYQTLLQELQCDVGAMMWKGKRMRFYSVKPIDKIMPRRIMSHFGQDAVQIATHPAVFRAPMLTSKIHTRFDPEFCKSTSYQLERTGLQWSDLWLTPDEQMIVSHYQAHGKWLTMEQLHHEQYTPHDS